MSSRVLFYLDGDSDDDTIELENVPAPMPNSTVEFDGRPYNVESVEIAYWSAHPGNTLVTVRLRSDLTDR